MNKLKSVNLINYWKMGNQERSNDKTKIYVEINQNQNKYKHINFGMLRKKLSTELETK